MYLKDARLVVSPTDLVGHIACGHRTELERQAAEGALVRPDRDDPMLELLAQRGLAHEGRELLALRAQGLTVVEIPDVLSLEERTRLTEEALLDGPDVIFQATFFDGRWRGHADFLLKRADRPSPRVPWSYDVADTKLSSKPKAAAFVQMALYGGHLERILGLGPELLTVITGDGQRHVTPMTEVVAYTRRQQLDFEAVLDGPVTDAIYPEPVDHCGYCRWTDVCADRRRTDDHLSLVAWMRRDHADQLRAAGITTVAQLAAAGVTPPEGCNSAIYERLHGQAVLQVRARETGAHCYEVLPPEEGRGFALLPPPSAGDLFLDLEGHPFESIEYLWGLSDAKGDFTAYWAHDDVAEKAAFEAVVDRIIGALDIYPELHVYHYAAYEKSALKRLMGKHTTREAEVDRLLRGGVFVDLYAVVRGGVRVSRESYSIKKLEVFYGFSRSAEVGDGATSVVEYERWMGSRDQSILDDIERYNEEDVASTVGLRDWLETLRAEVEAMAEVVRPTPRDGESSEKVARENAEVEALTAAVLARAEAAGDVDEQATFELAAGLVDWHRRESKPDWWAHFERLDADADDLVDDTSAIGRVTGPTAVGTVRRSTIWRYAFPPQETKLHVTSDVLAQETSEVVGTIHAIDAEAGWVEVARAVSKAPVVTAALLAPMPINDIQLRRATRRVITAALEYGLDGEGPYRAARALLARRMPRLRATSVPAGETPSGRVLRLGVALDKGCLPVQGPPGSGKTWTGARLVLDLVEDGKRVGITAFSHKAIGNMLSAIREAAVERGASVSVVQKCREDQECGVEGVTSVRSNEELLAAASEADVVAGTSYLWARDEMRDVVDTLVIDEAGQLSLANCLAVASAARDLVLLGDPQQLAQPAKATHPAGAGMSGLERVLGGQAVISPDLGVFLAETHRLAPAVCDFVSMSFYDGRLDVAGGCERQRILGDDDLSGAGVRWRPVVHTGRRSSSSEEVAVVAEIVSSLLGRHWIDRTGTERVLGVDDVLVLTPYNVQAGLIRAAVPEGVRVGTVDKLQGQEAAAVVYSTTSSSVEDVPRGLEFLYSPNRFNVAVSRARALCVLVGSPALLRARCRTVDQLRRVNRLCRYVEHAAGPA